MIIITKLLFSMKHGIITIYIIYFLNRGTQDRHRKYIRYLWRNKHFKDQLNIFPCYFHYDEGAHSNFKI